VAHRLHEPGAQAGHGGEDVPLVPGHLEADAVHLEVALVVEQRQLAQGLGLVGLAHA
jgi:hypothetical protein